MEKFIFQEKECPNCKSSFPECLEYSFPTFSWNDKTTIKIRFYCVICGEEWVIPYKIIGG